MIYSSRVQPVGQKRNLPLDKQKATLKLGGRWVALQFRVTAGKTNYDKFNGT